MTDTMGMSLAELRKDYMRQSLSEADVKPDPFEQFSIWFEQALATSGQEANAMTVATAGKDGIPAARMVLLKGFDHRGFIFFSSYNSPKGQELAENPAVALLFYWPELERQVRIGGAAERMSREESTAYFRQRPRGSQIAAAFARQSQVIADRSVLEAAMEEFTARFEGQEVPVPEQWGGFRVAAEWFEFWQGRPSRLHDRIRYRRDSDQWIIERLAP